MSYGPVAQAAAAGGVDALDNVFVTPAAHRAFLATGRWPESTMFVLEIRTAEETGSIVTRGRYQTDLVGLEAAVKDSARFGPTGWGYFAFDIDERGATAPAAPLPASAGCQACHARNAAVEQTFTQFYPTLWPVARAMGTVRADFAGVPPSAAEVAERVTTETDGATAARQMLDATAAHWPAATVLRESSLNRLGYRLQARHRDRAALVVFEEVARRFPASANAWDSLSEAYEAAGAADRARDAVARGLTALATDTAMAPARRTAIDASLRERQQRLAR